jgi:integrase
MDGEPVEKTGHDNFRKRRFDPAVKAAGLDSIQPTVTPYTLRHSCASLLLHEGRNVVEVARIMGHAPEECLRTYLHEMDEIAGQGPVDGDDLIVQAQARKVATA